MHLSASATRRWRVASATDRLFRRRPVCGPTIPLLYSGGALSAACLVPRQACAHIKWFEPYDVAEPPMPILGGVLTAHFVLVMAGFTLLVFGGFLLDRLVARSDKGPAARRSREALEERLMRAGTGAFFMALFAMGGVILTPELRTDASWPGWLAFGIAASMLSPRSCILGAAGILVLYGYGVAEYGMFHLTDYPMFLGVAAYMALTSMRSATLRSFRMPVLYLSVCAGLMWGAVEKWAYPHWFFPLLAERPYLAMGLPVEDFIVLAGFVEFTLAFYILTGLGLLRLGIFGLGGIFLLAIVDFGKLDAIGHLPILVPLGAMFLHGPTAMHRWLHRAGRHLLAEGGRAGVSFTAAMAVCFVAYYGLQRTGTGHGAGPSAHASLAAPTGAQVQTP